MKRRMMGKIAVLVTSSALALSFPVASSFGVPTGNNGNNGKACPHKGSQGKGPKKPAPNNKGKGKKCGFNKQNGNGNGPPNGPPNGGPSCPSPFPGQGNELSTSVLPSGAQDSSGLFCGFTGTNPPD
jgi:hypothetical protein